MWWIVVPALLAFLPWEVHGQGPEIAPVTATPTTRLSREQVAEIARQDLIARVGPEQASRTNIEIVPPSGPGGWWAIYRDLRVPCAQAAWFPGACRGAEPSTIVNDFYVCIDEQARVYGWGQSPGHFDARGHNPCGPPSAPPAMQQPISPTPRGATPGGNATPIPTPPGASGPVPVVPEQATIWLLLGSLLAFAGLALRRSR